MGLEYFVILNGKDCCSHLSDLAGDVTQVLYPHCLIERVLYCGSELLDKGDIIGAVGLMCARNNSFPINSLPCGFLSSRGRGFFTYGSLKRYVVATSGHQRGAMHREGNHVLVVPVWPEDLHLFA